MVKMLCEKGKIQVEAQILQKLYSPFSIVRLERERGILQRKIISLNLVIKNSCVTGLQTSNNVVNSVIYLHDVFV